MSTPGSEPPNPVSGANAVTRLLLVASDASVDGMARARAGQELLPILYDELRRLAHARMDSEPGGGAGQTLQPTALVHEAYVRLLGDGDVAWNSRGHFFAAAARAMQRILVDRARARRAQKRGGDRNRVAGFDLDSRSLNEEPASDSMLALDAAMDRLRLQDERKAEVVALRVFAGLSVEQVALALGVSEPTVKRDWAFARAWLRREIGADAGGSDSGADS